MLLNNRAYVKFQGQLYQLTLPQFRSLLAKLEAGELVRGDDHGRWISNLADLDKMDSEKLKEYKEWVEARIDETLPERRKWLFESLADACEKRGDFKMRMWMVNPAILCRGHLLGEHRELHALACAIRKRMKTLPGFVSRGLVELSRLNERHEDLANEIIARGYEHASPWTEDMEEAVQEGLQAMFPGGNTGQVDIEKSLDHLLSICHICRSRHKTEMKNNV